MPRICWEYWPACLSTQSSRSPERNARLRLHESIWQQEGKGIQFNGVISPGLVDVGVCRLVQFSESLALRRVATGCTAEVGDRHGLNGSKFEREDSAEDIDMTAQTHWGCTVLPLPWFIE